MSLFGKRLRLTFFVVLLTTTMGTVPSLHAQSLTAEQQSKLDGRLETVVRMANQGTLSAEIAALSEKGPSLDVQTSSEKLPLGREGTVEGPRQGKQGRGAPSGSPDLPTRLPQDVRPVSHRPDGTPVYEAVVHTQEASALDGVGVQVTSAFDDFTTVRATPADLQTLSQLEAVDRVLSARRVQLHNDEAAAEAGVRTANEGIGGTAYRGQDVMACVIDSGIDWSHPDFTNENGNTRIHSIWDQPDDSTDAPTPVENDDSRFGPNFNPDYGSEYFTSDVENGTVSQQDRDGHGTHVTGTVASSGRAFKQSSGTTKYRGVAPDANIIAVRTGFTGVSIADGINYCKSVAEANGRPVVVNMSLGTDFAPHDGTSPLAQVVDAITNGGTASGTAVVTSAGNSGSPSNPIHTSGNIATGDSADVPLTVPDYEATAGTQNDVYVTSLWTYEDGPYSISVYTPGAQDTLTISIDDPSATVDSLIDTPRGGIFVESAPNPIGSTRYFQVQSFDLISTRPPAEGTWTIRLRSEGSQSTDYHGWFLGSTMGAAFDQADNAYTISSPATSESAIAVGAYVHRQRWSNASGDPFGFPLESGFTRDHVAAFSSRGPTVDGRQKPAVAAPGAWTISALSSQAPSPSNLFLAGDGEHQLLTGTSMSAPITAGTVALLLQEDPSLSTNDARTLLTQTARIDDRVEARGGSPNPTFGHGKVDALRALTRLRSGASNEVPVEILSYEDAFGNAFGNDNVTSEPVGETGPARVALRFTPSQAGAVTGAHVSVGFNNDLTDSLYVQVWSDDGSGAPDAPLGNRVAVPASRLTPYTPTFIRLRSTRVTVEADSSYHLVLTPKDNGGTLEVLTETVGSTAGRSMAFAGSSWTDTGNDLAIRTQVGGGLSTQDQTPPSVPGVVTARGFADSVTVDWGASPSSDVAKYRVYRDTAPIDSSAGPGDVAAYDSVSAATTAYTDTSIQVGTQYHYRVTAVDDPSNESSFSGEATATPLFPPKVAVSPSSLSETLAGGDSSEKTLQIENDTTGDVHDLDFQVLVRQEPLGSDQSAPLSNGQRLARGATTWNPPPTPEAEKGTFDSSTNLQGHSGSTPTIINDPIGDAEEIDVTRVDAGVKDVQMNVVIENASDVDPNDYAGVLSFDVDQNTSTGVDPISGNPDQELGAEFAAFLNAPEGVAILVDAESQTNLASLPLQVDSSTVHFSIPLSLLETDPPIDATGVIGSLDAPTDWFPNAGNATVNTSWLAVSPTSGSVPPGSTQDLTASLDATSLKDSTYEATVRVTHNDPDRDTVDVPVSLTVNRPEGPATLSASVDTTAIALTWDAPGDPSVVGYNVYRSTAFFTTPGGATKVNDSPLSETQLTDTGLDDGTTYYYRVAAVDGDGTESVLSDPAQAMTEGLLVDGQLGESEYIALGTSVDAADGFSPANDIDSLLYYPDPAEEALYIAVAGTLATGDFNGYAVFLNVTGASAPNGAPAGDSLGFPFEGTNHHFLTGEQGANTDFTADFEVDYVLLASPAGSNTTGAEAAAYSNSGRAVTRLGFTDEAGTAQSGTGPGGNTVTFAHLNSEASLTGAEFKVPFSELGGFAGGEVTADQNLQVFAVIVSATGYFSNETIPGDGTQIADSETDGPGNPGNNAQWDAYAGGPYHTGGDGLPVELATFEGRTDEDRVVLQWQTASETNNAEFRIQRRDGREGGSWQTIGNVEGAGTTTSGQSYRFADTDLPYAADSLTYRLKQVDTDGTTHLTEAVTVTRSAIKDVELLKTYPNPVQQRATVRYAVPERQEVTLRLYDILGRQVQTVVNEDQEGRHQRNLDVSGLASGVYFLRLRAGGTVRTRKLTVVQ